MHHTFDEPRFDLPVAYTLMAVSGVVLLVIVAGIISVVIQDRRRAARARAQRAAVEKITAEPVRRKCGCTGCGHTGWIPVTWRDGTSGVVCAGDYNNGQLQGWFA